MYSPISQEQKLLSICQIPPQQWKVEEIDFDSPEIKENMQKCLDEQEKSLNINRTRFK